MQLMKQTTPTPQLRATMELYLNISGRNAGKKRTHQEYDKVHSYIKTIEQKKDCEKIHNEERTQMGHIEKAWQLLNLLCGMFSPTRDFERTLLAHIDNTMESEHKIFYTCNIQSSGSESSSTHTYISPLTGYTAEVNTHIEITSMLAQYALSRLQKLALFGKKDSTTDTVDAGRIASLTDLVHTMRVFWLPYE